MVDHDIDVHSYVLYLSEFNALICRTCQHGLTREGVARHFQRHHKSISNRIRKQLSSFASSLRVSNVDEIIFPSVEIEAIDGLDVIDGFACQECGWLYGTLKSIQKHCRARHGWVQANGIDITSGPTD
jgi:uncharacterized C2H2 Zn-finger protein